MARYFGRYSGRGAVWCNSMLLAACLDGPGSINDALLVAWLVGIIAAALRHGGMVHGSPTVRCSPTLPLLHAAARDQCCLSSNNPPGNLPLAVASRSPALGSDARTRWIICFARRPTSIQAENVRSDLPCRSRDKHARGK